MAKWTIEIELKKISKASFYSLTKSVDSDDEKDVELLKISDMIERDGKTFIYADQVFIKSNIARVIALEVEEEDE